MEHIACISKGRVWCRSVDVAMFDDVCQTRLNRERPRFVRDEAGCKNFDIPGDLERE